MRWIAAATKNAERTPISLTGDHTQSHGTSPDVGVMIFGSDISGIDYGFSKVVFDSKSTVPEAFTLNTTLRFGF